MIKGYYEQLGGFGKAWTGLAAVGLVFLFGNFAPSHAQPSGGTETVTTNTVQTDGTYPTAPTAAAISEWLRKTTNIAPSSAIAVGNDMVVSVANLGTRDQVTNIIKDVRLRGETISPKFSDLIQGRSTQVSMDVDCTKSMILIHQTDVYPGSNLVGTPRILPGSQQWIKPIGTAYLAETINSVCQPRVPPRPETAQAPSEPPPSPYQKPLQQAYVPPPAPPPVRAPEIGRAHV